MGGKEQELNSTKESKHAQQENTVIGENQTAALVLMGLFVLLPPRMPPYGRIVALGEASAKVVSCHLVQRENQALWKEPFQKQLVAWTAQLDLLVQRKMETGSFIHAHKVASAKAESLRWKHALLVTIMT